MATRRRKSLFGMDRPLKAPAPGGSAFVAPWMITFSDVMLLLLTFFITLVAMSSTDERSRVAVMESVSSAFGPDQPFDVPWGDNAANLLTLPGVMSQPGVRLDSLRKLMADEGDDVRLQQNSRVIILSVGSDLLFQPGGTAVSDDGKRILGRLLPYLQNMQYPMLIAGHTSPRLDEEGAAYAPSQDPAAPDSTWGLSMRRAQAVYLYYQSRGIAASKLSMEGFGQHFPSFPNNTPEGRRRNRRVDLVLDRRNRDAERLVPGQRDDRRPLREYYFRDFRFDLSDQPAEPENRSGASGSGAPSGAGASEREGRL